MFLPPEKDEPEPDKPLWVEPPLEVMVKDFLLADATIYREKEKLATVKEVGLECTVEGARARHRDADGEAG